MNQENKQTPEELSLKWFPKITKTTWGKGYSYDNEKRREGFIKSFNEYTAPLQARIADLEKKNEHLSNWKESAMKTFSELNLPECANLLNIGLGQSIAPNLVPKIKDLKAENERLKKENDRVRTTNTGLNKYVKINYQKYTSCFAENQKLREALDKIMKIRRRGPIFEIAKEALKGGSDES